MGSGFGDGQGQINHMAAATGTYLLIAADGNSSFNGSGGYTLNLGGATGTVVRPPVLDVDASIAATKYDALTDGLIVMRYLLGSAGPSLTLNALGGTATRTDPAVVREYLDKIRGALDIDGNGNSDALTDGVLILRYLLGLRGDALIANAVAAGAPRSSANDIETYILTLMP